MFPTLRQWLAIAVLVVTLLVFSTIGASAKSLTPTNQYGPISVQVSVQCPSAQTIVNISISQPIQSITLSGQVNGSIHLYDQNGLINTNVTGSAPYSFTTKKSDALNACLTSASSGTVSFQGQLNMFSGNWAGYTVEGLSASPNKYEDVIGEWTVPTILSCSFTEVSESTQWIGLGGAQFTGSSEIEQIGTDQQCHHGVEYQTPVYEDYYPGQKGFSIINNACPITVAPPCANPFQPSVFAGDKISAQVAHQADGNFFLFEADTTQKWVARETLGATTSTAQSSAEWIEEAPMPLLTHITQVQFTSCLADSYSISSAGPSVQNLTLKPAGSPALTQTSAIQNGNSFTISFPSH